MTIPKRKEKADFFFKNDLELCRQNVSTRMPVNHQQDAINKLNEWFEAAEQPSGTIMVLPTGSGKTFTAIRFLCQGPISKGYKILWLAHTHHLLEQAYFSFLPENKNQGYEIGWISNSIENIGIRVVSGSPNNFKVDQIKESDDIVIATLQTITNAYKNKHPKLEKFLESACGKLIVVFDEAHHAPAPSYRKLLIGDDSQEIRESLRERFPEMYILGLTATPTYNDEEKRGWLKEIFPQEIIYQAQIKDLIFEKILANPHTIESETEIPLELDDMEYQRLVREYEKDIPQKMIKRLAENKNRNQYIVDTYVKNKNRYGKTIIFADRREQCEYLNKLLLDNGIRSDVMYSASGKERENINALEEFKNNNLEVIVNIRMLTEGTDVPNVDSVFLTRQTTSEILLTQMVGRALRGPRFGGTEDAHLVFFIDNWKQQINWAKWDPKTWGAKREMGEEPSINPPWDLISVKVIQGLIDKLGRGESINGSFFSSMPVGWYPTKFFKSNESENADGSDGKVNELILVFEDNKEGYGRLIDYLQGFNIEKFDDEEIKFEDCKDEINELCNKFFTPAEEQIDRDILKNIFRISLHIAQDRYNKAPEFLEFEDRDNYDLDMMAEEFIDADYGPRTVDQKLRELYEDKNQIWTTIYYTYDLFKSQFNSSVDWILKKKNGFIIDEITTEEQKLVEKLKSGTLDEKIGSCNDLMDIGTKDAIHEDTLELLIETSENDDNEKLREAAEYAVNKILLLELNPAQKRRIKKRDGYKCLCCGEDAKYLLQVDHINPRYFGVDNSDENLQTLCSICNGTKGTETIDFSKKVTNLEESELKFPDIEKIINELDYEKDYHIKDPKWWKKYLKRKINFIYRCGAIKSIFIEDKNNFHNWEIELHDGNNPEWIMSFIRKIKPYIQAIRKSNGLFGPGEIDVFESSDREQKISYLQDAVIVPAKLALDEYLEHSVYMCQPGRSFRPVDYFGFYFDGKISRYIPKILGKVEDVEFTLEGVENANLSKNTKRKLLSLLESLEKSDSVGRLGYRNKVIFLSSKDSKDTIKLKNEIINDTKSKAGKSTAFTQNQRYVMVRKLMKNPKKTSEL